MVFSGLPIVIVDVSLVFKTVDKLISIFISNDGYLATHTPKQLDQLQ